MDISCIFFFGKSPEIIYKSYKSRFLSRVVVFIIAYKQDICKLSAYRDGLTAENSAKLFANELHRLTLVSK